MDTFGDQGGHAPRSPVPGGEPILRAPWPVVALVAAILIAYAAQSFLMPVAEAAARYGFASGDLGRGRWIGLLTAMFVHAGWTHAGLNALAALAFGAPIARMTGGGPRGVSVFFAFYLACGVLASLAYAAVAPSGLLVGASGAIAGLMGATSRLAPHDPQARLAPLTSRPVVGMGLGWLVVNLLIGLTGVGLGPAIGPVAWQAHLGGYAAGLLLAPLARRLAGQGALRRG